MVTLSFHKEAPGHWRVDYFNNVQSAIDEAISAAIIHIVTDPLTSPGTEFNITDVWGGDTTACSYVLDQDCAIDSSSWGVWYGWMGDHIAINGFSATGTLYLGTGGGTLFEFTTDYTGDCIELMDSANNVGGVDQDLFGGEAQVAISATITCPPDPIYGCTDSSACNYDPIATHDDDSCWYANLPCTCDDGEDAIEDECGVCNGDGSSCSDNDSSSSNQQSKIILKNKPTGGAMGQYNYGDVGNGDTILGIETGGVFSNSETELFTLVEHSDLTLSGGGTMWLSQGSKLEVTSCVINMAGIDSETDSGYYPHVKVAMYVFDSDISGNLSTMTGNVLKTKIGEGDDFGSSPNLIGYWNKGKSDQFDGLGDVVSAGTWGDEGLTVRDFPKEASSTNDSFKGGQIFETDMDKWTDAVMGKRNSSLYVVIRVAGDEREYAPFGHGWWGLSGGFEVDEMDRTYAVCRISKSQLFNQWKNFSGEEITLNFSPENKSDSYGDNRGHKYLNTTPRLYDVASVTIKITTPIWSPAKALNNNGSLWVDTETYPITLLHPQNKLDFIGWNSWFYGSYGSNYFKTQNLLNNDFRPISNIWTSPDPEAPTDLQSYYIKDRIEYAYASAPNIVNLKFTIAENLPNFYISYKDIDPDALIKYGYFVDNWDWKKGEPETLEEITDNFPINASEIDYRVMAEQEYDFKQIGTDDEITEHPYSSPGLKVIKAVVFTYMENDWDDGDGNFPFSSYIQAIHWKVIDIRINLNRDNTLMKDFNEVGGTSFSYMPYPEPVRYCSDYISTIYECDPENIVIGSHPIISGLSAESSYVQSLKNIINTNKFNELEGGEKADAQSAYENSPGQERDEYGNYIGNADIAQVRYFRDGTIDLPALLEIQTIGSSATDFYPHWDDEHWDGISNSFPKETSVGDIFIDGYPQYFDKCLVELNGGEIDGTTIRDSSGSGNKGILFGDYSIKKAKKGKPTVKNSYFKLPKVGKDKGAF